MRRAVLCLLAFWVLGGLAAARAEVLTVSNGDDDGPGSLRALLAAAADGDSIQFDPSLESVTVTSADLTVTGKSVAIDGGAGGLVLDFDGRPIGLVVAPGAGLELRRLTVSGAVGAALIVEAGAEAAVEAVLFAGNGDANTPGSSDRGGAIRALGAAGDPPLHVVNCTFHDNLAAEYEGHSAHGGAIYAAGRDVLVSYSTFWGNSAINSDAFGNSIDGGGGLYATAGATITSRAAVYYYNSSADGVAAEGGAIVSAGANFYYDCAGFDDSGDDDVQAPDLQTFFSPVRALGQYAGPTASMPPGFESEIIDRAADCLDAAGQPVDHDARGLARPAGGCDSGAVEALATVELGDELVFAPLVNGRTAVETFTVRAHLDDVVVGVYGAPEHFSVDDNACARSNPQAAGEACAITLSAAPPDDSTVLADWRLHIGREGGQLGYDQWIALQAGAGLPQIDHPDAVAAGSAAVGGEAVEFELAVTNAAADLQHYTHPAPLTIESVVLSGPAAADFALRDELPRVVEDVGLRLVFAPSDFGAREAVASVHSDDPVRPVVDVALSGTGLGVDLVLSADRLDFGRLPIGERRTESLTVGNAAAATAALEVSAALESGSAFRLADDCGQPLQPGAACTVEVTFDPADLSLEPGDERACDGQLVLSSNDPDEAAVTLPVAGVAFAPSWLTDLEITPASVDFGRVPAGGAADETLTLHNSGQHDIAVGGVDMAGDTGGLEMDASDCEGAVLAPAAACSVELVYHAAAAGDYSGWLSIRLDNGEQTRVDLRCTVYQPDDGQADDGQGGGCGCHGAPGSGRALIGLGLLLWIGLSRRRTAAAGGGS